MNTYRLKIALTEKGKITLENLPFEVGQTVEIVISPQKKVPSSDNSLPLEGTVHYYDDPFEPVASDEWEVLNEVTSFRTQELYDR
ncbi:hypothetical protein [Crocosphaera sp.]|uniref:hypothetical protein n=1 Tax=Crocosphaera sp. TaxID=2729996 RepID=UPI003F259E8D|nr:hypothetical protein [Crocosphaera sp.]